MSLTRASSAVSALDHARHFGRCARPLPRAEKNPFLGGYHHSHGLSQPTALIVFPSPHQWPQPLKPLTLHTKLQSGTPPRI
jgi:hypothetical protein